MCRSWPPTTGGLRPGDRGREEDSARAFVAGWLRTGDQAAIEAGRIRVLGRVKETIVTSTGEKIAAADLEPAVTADLSFASASAFGDERPFIGCALVRDGGYRDGPAARLGLEPRDPASLQARPATEAVLQAVRELTRSFPYCAQPRGAVRGLEPCTIENTLPSPTLELKKLSNLAAHVVARIARLSARGAGAQHRYGAGVSGGGPMRSVCVAT